MLILQHEWVGQMLRVGNMVSGRGTRMTIKASGEDDGRGSRGQRSRRNSESVGGRTPAESGTALSW